ncbi:hypothetical protein AYI68_g1995 [Smittium mucronatum]|uniref:PH domain-containing protein n=1 Tax=Smittium mucronatum TaxID=133383 RepID=A0A1R0H443_9FUNG|nr:hypothetical protein AYI68_g1995 [Smittium mucronatum]
MVLGNDDRKNLSDGDTGISIVNNRASNGLLIRTFIGPTYVPWKIFNPKKQGYIARALRTELKKTKETIRHVVFYEDIDSTALDPDHTGISKDHFKSHDPRHLARTKILETHIPSQIEKSKDSKAFRHHHKVIDLDEIDAEVAELNEEFHNGDIDISENPIEYPEALAQKDPKENARPVLPPNTNPKVGRFKGALSGISPKTLAAQSPKISKTLPAKLNNITPTKIKNSKFSAKLGKLLRSSSTISEQGPPNPIWLSTRAAIKLFRSSESSINNISFQKKSFNYASNWHEAWLVLTRNGIVVYTKESEKYSLNIKFLPNSEESPVVSTYSDLDNTMLIKFNSKINGEMVHAEFDEIDGTHFDNYLRSKKANKNKNVVVKLSFILIIKFPSVSLFHQWYQEISRWIRYSYFYYRSKESQNLVQSFVYPPLHVMVKVPALGLSVSVSTIQAYMKGSGKTFVEILNKNHFFDHSHVSKGSGSTSANSAHNLNPQRSLYKLEQHFSSKATVWDVRDMVLYSLITASEHSKAVLDLINNHASNSLSIGMAWEDSGVIDWISPHFRSTLYSISPTSNTFIPKFSENELVYTVQSMGNIHNLELRSYKPFTPSDSEIQSCKVCGKCNHNVHCTINPYNVGVLIGECEGLFLLSDITHVRPPNEAEAEMINKNKKFKLSTYERVYMERKDDISISPSNGTNRYDHSDTWFIINFKNSTTGTGFNNFYVKCPTPEARDSWMDHLNLHVHYWKDFKTSYKKNIHLIQNLKNPKLSSYNKPEIAKSFQVLDSLASKINWGTDRSYNCSDVIHHGYLYRKSKKHKAFKKILCILAPGKMVEFRLPKLTGLEALESLKYTVKWVYLNDQSVGQNLKPIGQKGSEINSERWTLFFLKRKKSTSLKSIYVTSSPNGVFNTRDKSEAPDIKYQSYANFFKKSSKEFYDDESIKDTKDNQNSKDHKLFNASSPEYVKYNASDNPLYPSEISASTSYFPKAGVFESDNTYQNFSSALPLFGHDYLQNELTFSSLLADRFQLDGRISHDNISLCSFTFLNPVNKIGFFGSTVPKNMPLSAISLPDPLIIDFENKLRKHFGKVKHPHDDSGQKSRIDDFTLNELSRTISHFHKAHLSRHPTSLFKPGIAARMYGHEKDVFSHFIHKIHDPPSSGHENIKERHSSAPNLNIPLTLFSEYEEFFDAKSAYDYLKEISYRIPFYIAKPVLVELGLAQSSSTCWTDTEVRRFDLAPGPNIKRNDIDSLFDPNSILKSNSQVSEISQNSFAKKLLKKKHNYVLNNYGNIIIPSLVGEDTNNFLPSKEYQTTIPIVYNDFKSSDGEIHMPNVPSIENFGDSVTALLDKEKRPAPKKKNSTVHFNLSDISSPLLCFDAEKTKQDYDLIESLSKYAGFDQYKTVYVAESQNEMKLWVTILNSHISSMISEGLW